ncbi:hypothetical protein BBI15_01390 [Planococcus plakortidis]|uniref:Uncharacterized protein n=1 Tax=Planococcus plakortidis TaxID=1038856 RepID=A0A1C7E4S3_9BACL|nr:hypothetical protein BBI15_01390 [Planococcus plakortidis]
MYQQIVRLQYQIPIAMGDETMEIKTNCPLYLFEFFNNFQVKFLHKILFFIFIKAPRPLSQYISDIIFITPRRPIV